MSVKAVLCLVIVLSVCLLTTQGQAVPPQLAPAEFLGRVTTTSVILQGPTCMSDSVCPGCEIWLVAARSSATGNFDAQANTTTPFNLSTYIYPTAFAASAPQFFLTKVGPQNMYCNNISSFPYFIVGKEGVCTGSNCNGALPENSTISFKYILYDSTNKSQLKSTNWSDPISLITTQSYQNIDDSLSARSGAMVVITTLLSVAAALLLLLFFIMLCVSCGTNKDGSRGVAMTSIRIPHYDTHNLKEHVHPYDNPAYEADPKNCPPSKKSGSSTHKQ